MVSNRSIPIPAVHRRWRTDFSVFAALLVIDLAAAVFLARGVLAYRAFPFDADEAAHALPALLMTQELVEGNLSGFLNEAYGQNFYPPGTAVFLIPAYLIAGPSPATARFTSVLCLFLAVLVLFALAREIDPARGAIAGLIAALLTLSARPLLVNAGLAMLEAPGLLVSLLLLWAYVRASRQRTAARLVWVGLLLTAAFLTKYTYGIVSLAAIGMSELVELRPSNGRERFLRRWSLMFGPFLVAMAVWFLRPGQLSTFFGYTRPLSDGQAWLSLQNILYYPRSFAIHSAPSVLFAFVNLAALIWAFINRSEVGVRVLLLYFLFGMAAVMLVNHPPNPRFTATFVPAAQLLTGLMIVRLWPHNGRDARDPSVVIRILSLAAILVLTVASVPVVWARYDNYLSLMQARLETSPELARLAEWVAATMPAGESVYLINHWDEFGPLQLEWETAVRNEVRSPQVIGRVLEPPTPDQIAALRAEILNGNATALILIEGGPWGAPFWPDYAAGLENNLQELGGRSFHLESYGVSDWLDDNSLWNSDWKTIKSDSKQAMDIGVIIYKISR